MFREIMCQSDQQSAWWDFMEYIPLAFQEMKKKENKHQACRARGYMLAPVQFCPFSPAPILLYLQLN